MPARLSNDEAIRRLSSAHPNLDFSNTSYAGASCRLDFICPKHGERAGFYQVVLMSGCSECSKEKRTSPDGKDPKHSGMLSYIEEKRQKARHKWDEMVSKNTTLDFSKCVYTNTYEKVLLRCIEHDTWFMGNIRTICQGKTPNCPKCISTKLKQSRWKSSQKTDEQKLEIMNRVHGSEYQYALPLPGNTYDLMTIFCKKHGEFKQTYHNHVDQRTRCPVCAKTSSRAELELRNFVKTLTNCEVTKDRKQLYPKEIDIYVAEKKLGVEYHGLYHHSGENTNHRKKYEMCEEKGIRLIQLFEDEWSNKRPVIEDLIRAALGCRETIYARNTEFCEISTEESRVFFNRYHVNGAAGATYKFGLRMKGGMLVAAISFSKPRFNNTESLEILRYATSMNIIGGFEKLFSSAVKILNPESIVTYADLRFGRGTTYIRAGFKQCGITEPDYWWWKKGSDRISRYQVQRHKLKNDARFSKFYAEDLTEKQICEAAGYVKVLGVGHKKFTWRNPSYNHP